MKSVVKRVHSFFGDPYVRVSPKRGERGWHPDYDHAVRGIHLGDLRTPPTLAELAPGELRRWMRDERQAYLNFESLSVTDGLAASSKIRALSRPLGQRAARQAVAREFGFTDIRPNAPKLLDWSSSLRDSNRPMELSLAALLHAMR